MEQNLPFVSVGIFDENYNNRVLPFLGKIDNGNLFKWFIVLFWKLAAYIFLLGGIYLTFSGIGGDDGYYHMTTSSEGVTGGQKTGAIVGLIIGIIISLVCSWFLYSVVKKRAEELEQQEYEGVLEYISHVLLPRFITLVGELAFTLIFYTALMQLIATLVGYASYAPLMGYTDVFMSLALPGLDMLAGMNPSAEIPNIMFGSYEQFEIGVRVAALGLAASFVFLMYFYALKQIYNYALGIVMNLLKFIPRFAIPIAIRNKQE